MNIRLGDIPGDYVWIMHENKPKYRKIEYVRATVDLDWRTEIELGIEVEPGLVLKFGVKEIYRTKADIMQMLFGDDGEDS